MTDTARKFMAVASKSHAAIAGEMAEEIKAVVYKHADKIPFVLALGVLRVVELELMDAQRDGL